MFSFFRKDKDLTPAEKLPGFYIELLTALTHETYTVDEANTTLSFADYNVSIVITPCIKDKGKINITIVPHPNNGLADVNPLNLDEPHALLLRSIQAMLKSILNPIEVV